CARVGGSANQHSGWTRALPVRCCGSAKRRVFARLASLSTLAERCPASRMASGPLDGPGWSMGEVLRGMVSPERGGQMTQEIEIRVDNGVQIIRLVRADKKNALTGPMYDAMSAALEEAERSDAIAAHVFLGSGGVFTAGNDINDFVRRAQDGSQHAA